MDYKYRAVPISNTVFNTIFGTGFVGPVSVLILWTILFYIFRLYTFQQNTIWKTYSGNRWKSDGCSVFRNKVQRIKMYVFMLSGALSAFAGVLYAGRMQSGRYSFGDGDEMSVIASVVLGGASMAGGSGSMIGALAGSILMNDQQCFDSCKPLICTAEDGKWFYYHCSSCTSNLAQKRNQIN